MYQRGHGSTRFKVFELLQTVNQDLVSSSIPAAGKLLTKVALSSVGLFWVVNFNGYQANIILPPIAEKGPNEAFSGPWISSLVLRSTNSPDSYRCWGHFFWHSTTPLTFATTVAYASLSTVSVLIFSTVAIAHAIFICLRLSFRWYWPFRLVMTSLVHVIRPTSRPQLCKVFDIVLTRLRAPPRRSITGTRPYLE